LSIPGFAVDIQSGRYGLAPSGGVNFSEYGSNAERSIPDLVILALKGTPPKGCSFRYAGDPWDGFSSIASGIRCF
jgi:hypothetical protein